MTRRLSYLVLFVGYTAPCSVITGVGLTVAADTADGIDITVVFADVGIKERGI